MIMFDWTQHTLLDSEILPYKLPAMEKASLAACDAKNGLADGLIDRRDHCQFDLQVSTCPGADGPKSFDAAASNRSVLRGRPLEEREGHGGICSAVHDARPVSQQWRTRAERLPRPWPNGLQEEGPGERRDPRARSLGGARRDARKTHHR